MPKVNLEDIRIGVSAFTQKAQVGVLSKTAGLWKHQKEIHNDFLDAVIKVWENQKQTIRNSKGEWEITVKRLK